MTIEEGVKLFLREKSAYCAERSMEYYRDSLGYFQKWTESEGKTEIDGLKSGDLLDYQAYLRERKKGNGSERIKNTSVNTYMRSVRIFVKWLEGEGFLSDRLKLPKRLRDDSNQVFVLTMDEVALLDRVVKENVLSFRISEEPRRILYLRNYLIFHLMLDAGLRMSEAVNLKMADVDLEKRLLYVNKGKGRKDRIIPLPEKLEKGFRDLFGLYAADQGENAFYHYGLEKPVTVNTVKQFMNKLRSKSGVKRLHAHMLRNPNLNKIQTFCQHSTPYMYSASRKL